MFFTAVEKHDRTTFVCIFLRNIYLFIKTKHMGKYPNCCRGQANREFFPRTQFRIVE